METYKTMDELFETFHPSIKKFYDAFQELKTKGTEEIKKIGRIDLTHLYHYDEEDYDNSYDDRPSIVTTTRRDETIWDAVNAIHYNAECDMIMLDCDEMGTINIGYCEGFTEVAIYEAILDYVTDKQD